MTFDNLSTFDTQREENVARSSGWFSQAAYYSHSRIMIVRIVALGLKDQSETCCLKATA